jgi:hypothetical protein
LQAAKKITNLTDDEVFWIRAQAVMTGASSSIAGISSIAGSLVPDNTVIGNLNAETIRSIAKSFGQALKLLAKWDLPFYENLCLCKIKSL